MDMTPALPALSPSHSGLDAHEVDREQAVFQVCTDHLHMVREIEALLEAAGRDALMQHLRALLLAFLARHQQGAAVLNQFDFAPAKAGNRHSDAVLVFALSLDIVRGQSDRTLLSSMSNSRSKPTVER